MSGATKARDFVAHDYKVYGQFLGMDRSRDRAAMDTGKQQHLWDLSNIYCDWRGRIVREPPAHRRVGEVNAKVNAVRFYNRKGVCFAYSNDMGITLASDRNHKLESVYPKSTPVSFANFKSRAIALAPAHDMYAYDGTVWKKVPTKDVGGAYGTAVGNRFAVAGMPKRPTEIWLCRVKDETVWPLDEDATSTDKSKALFIDVRNIIGTADEIVGLGSFETSRLAVFAQDQCLIYKIDDDYTQIALDQNANIKVGCISHRTICQADSDLMFCSRYGIHVIRRSDVNGIYVVQRLLSPKIEPLYKDLVRSVSDKSRINACYDPDNYQYHVFFPQDDDLITKRLTLTVRDLGTRSETINWSTGNFMGARCGDSLGGQFVLGTNGGIYNVLDRAVDYDALNVNDTTTEDVWPEFSIETPILWNGTATEYKSSKELILQASGSAKLVMLVCDEQGRKLGEREIVIEEGSRDDEFPDAPLDRSYKIPLPYRYRGLQLKFTGDEPGTLVILGFSIDVKKD